MTEAAAQIRVPLEKIAPDTIRLERTLDAPAQTVWRYLTEAELRRQWFMGGTDATGVGEFDLLVDHDNLSSDDVPYPESYAGFKGATWTEKVTRFEPPRLLVTSFQGGKNGTVTYELFRKAERRGWCLPTAGSSARLGHRTSAAAGPRISPCSRRDSRGEASGISGRCTWNRARR